MAGSCKAQTYLEIVKNHHSAYRIVLSPEASKSEQRAARLLQNYIKAATEAVIPIINESGLSKDPGTQTSPAIYLGRTYHAAQLGLVADRTSEGYRLLTDHQDLYILTGQGHAAQYAVYYFAEKYLGYQKYDKSPAVFSKVDDLQLPDHLDFKSSPAFDYRQSYYPMSDDPDYMNWHGLHRFEDLWGLWGHSFYKLVPPAVYYKTHPEYYALVNGKRQPTQLCLSNPDVVSLVIDTLKAMMANNPDAIYWSVAPNDGGGFCTCDACVKIDREEGGPQGSLIRFVNKVAAAFPDKKITTLAYGGTANAPLKTYARKNVAVFVSSIDIFREQPVRSAAWPAAVVFRKQLADWSRMAGQIFIWDYCVQFTNYLSPFPDLTVLADNFKFFKQQRVSGIFEEGSGDTYADAAELNSYVQAKLLWNPYADIRLLMEDFCRGYYGPGASSVLDYLKARDSALKVSGKHLDIYGNPMIDSKGFLSLGNMKRYQNLLVHAIQAVTPETVYAARVRRLQLGLEYIALQQSRFYGLDPGGFLQPDGDDAGRYMVRPEWESRVNRFVSACKTAGVLTLSEDGISPGAYGEEWHHILTQSWPCNLALHANVTLTYPFSEDYPAKGKQTLTDGMTGFNDFSYNWLCFYGTDMGATVDMGALKGCGKISINFLDDPRHWIFLPATVRVEVSTDGRTYSDLRPVDLPEGTEHTASRIVPAVFNLPTGTKIRYVRVTAVNPGRLPEWRDDTPKKPMIAADEIMITP